MINSLTNCPNCGWIRVTWGPSVKCYDPALLAAVKKSAILQLSTLQNAASFGPLKLWGVVNDENDTNGNRFHTLVEHSLLKTTKIKDNYHMQKKKFNSLRKTIIALAIKIINKRQLFLI